MGRDAKIRQFGAAMRPSPQAGFATAVAQGHVGPLDRFGNQIGVGHLVTYRSIDCDTVFQVVDVTPVMDPRQPGMCVLTLAATQKTMLPVNRPANQLMIVGEVPAAEEANPDAPPSGITLTDADTQFAADLAASSPVADPLAGTDPLTE